jgi:hypothetical protein
MAEVLRSFDTPVSDGQTMYTARVVGREASDGLWEGWLEFVPVDRTSTVLATGVESRQPGRSRLLYWATGLSAVYVEGAFRRARDPVAVTVRVEPPPATNAPARRATVIEFPTPAAEPVLDPFEIGARNLDILRQELHALNRPRLLNIIAAYDLNPGGEGLAWMTDAQLATFIVTSVEAILMRGC